MSKMEEPKKFFSREKAGFEEPEKENILVRFWFIPLVLFLLMALAMISFWACNQGLIKFPLTTSTSSKTTSLSTSKPEAQIAEESDEIGKIETDLEATDFSDLDKELEEIEADLATP